MFLFDRYYLCLIAFHLRWAYWETSTHSEQVCGRQLLKQFCAPEFATVAFRNGICRPSSPLARRGAGQTLESPE
jgi:hypothetical protein